MADATVLSPRKRAAAMALVTAPTILEAARQTGINERTLRSWRDNDPGFAAEVIRRRSAVVSAVSTDLARAGAGAVSVLASIAGNKKAPFAARLSAAGRLLDLMLRSEADGTLAARLEALEVAVTGLQEQRRRSGQFSQ